MKIQIIFIALFALMTAGCGTCNTNIGIFYRTTTGAGEKSSVTSETHGGGKVDADVPLVKGKM